MNVRAVAMCLLVACGSASSPPATPAPTPVETYAADAELAEAIDRFIEAHFTFRPNLAIDLGYHAYDGQVPDRSPDAITAEVARLRAARASFQTFDARSLSPRRRV